MMQFTADPGAYQACAMIILAGIVFVPALHIIYKKLLGNLTLSMIPAAIICHIPVMVFYNFNYALYYEQTSKLGGSLFEQSRDAFLLAFVFVCGGMILAWLLSSRLEKQEYRSLFHMISGFILLYFVASNVNIAVLILGVAIVLFMIGEYVRSSDDKGIVAEIVRRLLNPALRGMEIEGYIATFFFLLGSLIVVIFLPVNFALGAIAILGIGDPAAVFVGRRFGRNKWPHNPDKSVQGSGAMFAVSTIAMLMLGFDPIRSIVVAFSATSFESLPLKISDNLIIPIVSGMVMVGIMPPIA